MFILKINIDFVSINEGREGISVSVIVIVKEISLCNRSKCFLKLVNVPVTAFLFNPLTLFAKEMLS